MVFVIYKNKCTLVQAHRPREDKCVNIFSHAKDNPLYPSFQKVICHVSGFYLIEGVLLVNDRGTKGSTQGYQGDEEYLSLKMHLRSLKFGNSSILAGVSDLRNDLEINRGGR